MFISIYVPLYSSMTVHCHISNCKFFGGKSTRKGGAFMLQIDVYTENVIVYLANSELYGNYAANGGGLFLNIKHAYSSKSNMFIIRQCMGGLWIRNVYIQ